MTKPSKSFMSELLREGVIDVGHNNVRKAIFTEGDLMVRDDRDKTYIVPVTDATGENNIGVLVRAHGSERGHLWMFNKYVEPGFIRNEVTVRWTRYTPILLVCCHPRQVIKRYRKELKRYNIHVLFEDYEGVLWSSDSPSECADVYTDEEHDRIEHKRRM